MPNASHVLCPTGRDSAGGTGLRPAARVVVSGFEGAAAAASSDALAAPHVVVLDETLDLNAASELARTLAGFKGSPVIIDPSHVGRVGAQCIQVLVSAAKTWRADDIYFAVTPGSEPFSEGLDLLGLAAFFANERA